LAVAYATSPLKESDRRRIAIISFRSIDALKEAQREALQASRLASVGQLAAGIAHEINTPVQYVGDNLSFIGTSLGKLVSVVSAAQDVVADDRATADPGRTERLKTAIAAAKPKILLDDVAEAIQESLDGVEQISHIVLSMKEFSHPGTKAKTMTDINRALDSTLMVSRNVWKKVAEVEKDFDPSLPPVLCHAGEMNQVYLNLIVNAAQAIEASGKAFPGRITVSTRQDGDTVTVCVADTGTGVPQALLDKIFDPFFTTKDVGKGTGQGLAICRDVVVVKHGGSLTVGGNEGAGAIFTVRLPVDGGGKEEKYGAQ
jgi:signal transduction histidine kinase